MSDYPPTESTLIAMYAGAGSTSAEVRERYLAATQAIAGIKADVLREFGEKLAGTIRRSGDEVKELANSAAEHIERAANE